MMGRSLYATRPEGIAHIRPGITRHRIPMNGNFATLHSRATTARPATNN